MVATLTSLTPQKSHSYACRGHLNPFDILQFRAKAATLAANNSFKARTGIFRRQTYVVYAFQTKFALTFVLLSAFNTVIPAPATAGCDAGYDVCSGDPTGYACGSK